jgi:hypothetical protein
MRARATAEFYRESPEMRAVFEAHPQPVMVFAGHCHLNSATVVNGVLYCTTSNFPPGYLYRHIRLYANRIEVEMHASGEEVIWTDQTDELHPTQELYTCGLLPERDFIFRFATQTLEAM